MDARLIAEICAGIGVLGTAFYATFGWRFVKALNQRQHRDRELTASQSARDGAGAGAASAGDPKRAIEALKNRYAAGEIDSDEFQRQLDRLLGTR